MREAEVIHKQGETVILRGEDGKRRRFTAKEMRDRNFIVQRGGTQVPPEQVNG